MRVLINDAPRMLRDILERAILNEPDMEVIGKPTMLLPTDDRQLPPDVVVGMSDFQPTEGARVLLAQWPHSHVLIITERGHRVFRYELLPRGVDLGEMSPDQLVKTIRSLVHPERKPYAD